MAYCLIQCLDYLIQLLIKSQKFHENVHIYGSAEEMGIRLLNSFVLFLFLYLLHSFFMLSHKSIFVETLMDFLRLYLVSIQTSVCLCTFSVGSWSIDISTSGRLAGGFMNLVALPIEQGFSFQSSDGCLGLRSQTLQHFVLPLIWFSTITDQGDVSLIYAS